MPAPEEASTYEGRLATFESAVPTAKRGPAPKSRKPISWPLIRPTPHQLARAGFYFRPTPTYLDNVACFVCNKSLDGWNEHDDPILEHLEHSKDCGFALVAAIEGRVDIGERGHLHPLSEEMKFARRTTFRDSWPHEHKKGWVPKVEKVLMVEAGWHYAPTSDSDDYVACAHCGLALDGWEPKDDPFEEHQRRAVDCAFFDRLRTLIEPEQSRGRKGRASKASRLSTQSTNSNWMVLAPDSSMVEPDSIVSIVSNSSMARAAPKGRKGKTSKAKATKGRRASKQLETQMFEPEDSDFSVKVNMPPPPPAKRGKKRGSDEIDLDSVIDNDASQLRPQKTARTRGDSVVESSFTLDAAAGDHEIEKTAPKKPTRKRASKARGPRASTNKTRVASAASVASLRMPSPDEEALERELEAGLNSSIMFFDAQSGIEGPSLVVECKTKVAPTTASVASSRKAIRSCETVGEDSILPEPPLPKQTKGKTKGAKGLNASTKFQEVRPVPPATKAAAALLIGSSPLAIMQPAKGCPKRVTSRQTSKQVNGRGTRSSAFVMPESSVLVASEAERSRKSAGSDPGNESDASTASQSTIKRGSRKGRGAKKAGPASRNIEDILSQPIGRSAVEPEHKPAAVANDFISQVDLPKKAAPAAKQVKPKKAAAHRKQPHVATPSPSPQSSDAENQPPSSHPSALISRTPNAPSPPKRGMIDGAALKSSQEWNPLDLETVFAKSPMGKESESVKTMADLTLLTSPEKRMTVTEWQMFQARKREESLRAECERIVGVWEDHGNKALRTLEGIEVEEL
ncbi:MAG: hypothetical protein M1814_005494 [Vezdaea aestivalis]|nr:MAG: hypothetical protein M1814_005494 [Vezdaea aestivalis]